jgi:hypothetical protein
MRKQVDHSQLQAEDQRTHRTDNANHMLSTCHCQCSQSQDEDQRRTVHIGDVLPAASTRLPHNRRHHKKSHQSRQKASWIFITIYAFIFATLAIGILLTQNYVLLPVLSIMAEGLVVALYSSVGIHLPNAVKSLMSHRHTHKD